MSRFVRNAPHVSIQLEEQSGIHVPKSHTGFLIPHASAKAITWALIRDMRRDIVLRRDRVLVVGSAAYGKCSWMRMYEFQSSASLWNRGVHLLIYCEIIWIFQELISDTTMFVGWRTRVFMSADRLADSGSSNEYLWYVNTRLPWLLYSDLEIYIVNSVDF